MAISDLVLKKPDCPIYAIGNLGVYLPCDKGCLYCYHPS